MDAIPPAIAFQQAARRVMQRCDELASCTERPGEITRTFCSAAMREAQTKLRAWMQSAGMQCRLDAATNLIGRRSFFSLPSPLSRRGAGGEGGTALSAPSPSPQPSPVKGEGANEAGLVTRGKTLLIASHLDTVINAGRFDGPLGILMGLAIVELLNETQTALPFAIDIIAFCEEEGVRYQTPYIGSRAIVGKLTDDLLNRQDAAGTPMREALKSFGGDPDHLSRAIYPADQVIAYLEPHIEQGPILELENLPVGIVTGIAGQTRASVQFGGRAGHAGTTPMSARQDALAAAAEFVLEVERVGHSTPNLVATVGQLNVSPNVGNVIPGSVQLRLDLRHIDDAVRETVFNGIIERAESIAEQRKLQFQLDWTQHQNAVICDPNCTALLEQCVAETGIRPWQLTSGAGHDAAVIAPHFPTAMLFLRCRGGISHHPDESVSEADVAVGLETMWRFVNKPW